MYSGWFYRTWFWGWLPIWQLEDEAIVVEGIQILSHVFLCMDEYTVTSLKSLWSNTFLSQKKSPYPTNFLTAVKSPHFSTSPGFTRLILNRGGFPEFNLLSKWCGSRAPGVWDQHVFQPSPDSRFGRWELTTGKLSMNHKTQHLQQIQILYKLRLRNVMFVAGLVYENFSGIPSGKLTKNYGKSQFLMGKSTINGHFQ